MQFTWSASGKLPGSQLLKINNMKTTNLVKQKHLYKVSDQLKKKSDLLVWVESSKDTEIPSILLYPNLNNQY